MLIAIAQRENLFNNFHSIIFVSFIGHSTGGIKLVSCIVYLGISTTCARGSAAAA